MTEVKVIGAGLAGSEAAWQLAQRGFAVRLYEMKPAKMSPAHHSADFAELVCSNSLRSDELTNAVGATVYSDPAVTLGPFLPLDIDMRELPGGAYSLSVGGQRFSVVKQ